ncbi:MAG TPA: hypothetical protein VK116_01755, partial [Planctomycetota bacterium]|nr:hypothetical protein [Planctomycetota bacterium]
ELRLEANVASSVLARVSLGDEIVVSIDAVSRDVVGKVGEIVPWIDRRTRTGMLKIDLPREEELRPGHFGRARITTSTREAIAIPEAAAVRRGQLELVYVLRDDPTLEPSSRASLELVRFGRSIGTDGARLEVTSGLEAGARVIVSPPESLRDGDPVRIAEERATSSTPVDSTRSTFGG